MRREDSVHRLWVASAPGRPAGATGPCGGLVRQFLKCPLRRARRRRTPGRPPSVWPFSIDVRRGARKRHLFPQGTSFGSQILERGVRGSVTPAGVAARAQRSVRHRGRPAGSAEADGRRGSHAAAPRVVPPRGRHLCVSVTHACGAPHVSVTRGSVLPVRRGCWPAARVPALPAASPRGPGHSSRGGAAGGFAPSAGSHH